MTNTNYPLCLNYHENDGDIRDEFEPDDDLSKLGIGDIDYDALDDEEARRDAAELHDDDEFETLSSFTDDDLDPDEYEERD
jgi:hypothetical protein